MKKNNYGLFIELEESFKDMDVEEILLEGLFVDGAHHKQWYLEQALIKLEFDLEKEFQKWLEDEEYGEWEPGIPA